MSCGCHTRTYRYPHTWVSMEKHGLVIPRQVRTMLEERNRDLEDFLSSLPLCTECDEDGCEFSGMGSTFGEHPTLWNYSFDTLVGNSTTDGSSVTLGNSPSPNVWAAHAHVDHTSDDGSGSMPDLVLEIHNITQNFSISENIAASGGPGDWSWTGSVLTSYGDVGDPGDQLTVNTAPYSVAPGNLQFYGNCGTGG